MGKKGTGGWVRRRKVGNTTITQNSAKGITQSASYGNKSNRVTYSLLPNGKTKRTTTISMGGMTRRQTETWGGVKKTRKIKYRKGKPLSLFGYLFIMVLLYLIWIA